MNDSGELWRVLGCTRIRRHWKRDIVDTFTHQFCTNRHGWIIGTGFPYIRTSKRQYSTPVQYTCISSCLSWLYFALHALLPLKPYTRWEITCIAALYAAQQTPPFPGLWRFKDSRPFKQWTGDDSKALMKVSMAVAGVFWDAKHIARCIYCLSQNTYLHLPPNVYHHSSISVISCTVQKLVSQILLPLKWRWRHFMHHVISSVHLASARRVSIFHASTPWCTMCI